MTTEAIVTLEDLECITLNDAETQVEPYIWPALIKVDTSTISAPDGSRVEVIALSPDVASVKIKSSMQQGDLAPIPSSVATLRTRFADDVERKHLILIVTLLEMDETPKGAMRAGFKAYVSELRAAFKDEFLNLAQAELAHDEEGKQKIIERIKARIGAKTRAAIKDALSISDKAKIALGFLDTDDFVGSAIITFGEGFFLNTPNSAPITLVFQAKGSRFVVSPPSFNSVQKVPTLVRYHIRARLQARPPIIDRCQSQVNAVRAAKAVVDGVEKEIKALQTLGQHTFPQQSFEDEIEQLRKEKLVPALAGLKTANTALQVCRS
jgi:hypothetical protein